MRSQETSDGHPLEPPARNSPRATITTFLDSIDEAWELYSADDPGFVQVFRVEDVGLPTEIHYVQANEPIGGQQTTA